ncbi:AraC-type DNA-binding protein [Saccharopolyspora antimicrobica]|uniref:AraC family transcriptional regulator n=1 Tax=Saccharopolyspora antimicrobica TaxID=455193 RepID=A0A1I5G7X8_9PSEU|nr:AraC family transcriptional regulator [Saccharopolyspora antimicrobica]RKT83889.1 AraC family transcriptional regulator [Saccharopolyspora antimicrobica]SFO31969.1 AraC-type DNA-binding protein [Saccharopolyspora antimicrobica]
MANYAARRGARTGATVWRVRADGTQQHIVPDGVLDLMWFQDRLVVAGADTRAMTVRTRPGEVTWGLRLAPGVANALLGVPADELTDRRIELAELVSPPKRWSFEDDVADALEQVLIDMWARADPDRSLLRIAASLDRAARDGLSVRETAERHDLSERSLRRLSGRLFGYGPKSLAQIHRFQRALRLARSGLPLGEAAATAGYVDQAHFTRETKRLTGRTPAALARA